MLRHGVAALWLAALVCHAQRYSFQEYTEGLGNLNVISVAQDRTGFLWVGTENGLYRYDGHQFRRYDAGDGMTASAIENRNDSSGGLPSANRARRTNSTRKIVSRAISMLNRRMPSSNAVTS